MAVVRFVACLVVAFRASAVQVPDLQNFFSSSTGLAMSTADALALANKEVSYLTACGITVPMLQALKDAMYSVGTLNLGMADVRANLLPLAYQHANPNELTTLFQTLYGVSTLNLPRAQAQQLALDLAKKHVKPSILGPLYNVLYSISAVNLPRAQAQAWAVNLTAAGADADKLKSSYLDNVKRMAKDASLKVAIADAVDADLQGLATRYARDGKAYVAKEFQQYYADQWLVEWQAAPQQKRTAPDGIDYRASEYEDFFGAGWAPRWTSAPVAVLRKISGDGKTYTLDEFVKFYGNTWQAEWATAYEVLDLCAGLTQASCAAQPRCQWKAAADWTTSCVPKPLATAEAVVSV